MILYYLLLFLVPFAEHPRMPNFGYGITLVKLVGLVTAFAAVLRIMRRPQPACLFHWWEIRLFLVFLGIVLISALSTGLQPESVTPIVSYLSFLIFYVATIAFVDSLETLKRACMIVLASLFLASLLVFNQYLRWNVSRPGGALRDPNYYALAVIPMLAMSVLFLLQSRGLMRLFLLFGTVSLVGSNLLGASRAGMFGMAFSLGYVFLRSRKKVVLALAGTLTLGTIFLLLPSNPIERFLNPGREALTSSARRYEILLAGLKMVRDNPLTGIGVGKFGSQSIAYNPELDHSGIAHSTYVSVAAEMGIPALALFLLILFLAWRRARLLAAAYRGIGCELGERIARAVEIGIPAYAVTATFLTGEYSKQLWFLVFFGAAMSRLLLLQGGATAPPAGRAAPRSQAGSAAPILKSAAPLSPRGNPAGRAQIRRQPPGQNRAG